MGDAGITLRKLEFDEIVNRWDEFKTLSKNALNDTRNLTQIGERYETTMARFLLLCEQDVAQIWISSEDGNDRYLCLSFIGNSMLSGFKNLTLYSVVRMSDEIKNVNDHWINALQSVSHFAKQNNCKRIFIETDLDYLVSLFKEIVPNGIIRQTLKIDL